MATATSFYTKVQGTLALLLVTCQVASAQLSASTPVALGSNSSTKESERSRANEVALANYNGFERDQLEGMARELLSEQDLAQIATLSDDLTQDLLNRGLTTNEAVGACALTGNIIFTWGASNLTSFGAIGIVKAFFSGGLLTNKLASIHKYLIAVVAGSTIMTACPPFLVPGDFSTYSRQEKLDWALSRGFAATKADDLLLSVDEPTNPGSCQRTVQMDLLVDPEYSGEVNRFEVTDPGTLPPLPGIALIEPFGTFPSPAGDLNSGFLQPGLFSAISFGLRLFASSTPPPQVIDTSDSLSLFPGGLTDNLAWAMDIMPDLSPFFEDPDRLSWYTNPFESWQPPVTVLDLPGDAVGMQLEVGSSEIRFQGRGENVTLEDLLGLGGEDAFFETLGDVFGLDGPVDLGFNLNPYTEFFNSLTYEQEVTVTEGFAPEFVVLTTEVVPSISPNPIPIVQSLVYEALFPTGVDRGLIQPYETAGGLTITDNCDQAPRLIDNVPPHVPLGISYHSVAAEDASGNRSSDYWVKIEVIDTIPPDLPPTDAVTVEVPAGSTAPLGPYICTDYLCQINDPVPLFPPPFFDLASLAPQYGCTVSNTIGADVPCEAASVPIGNASTAVPPSVIRWTATDAAGNSSSIDQLVAFREVGSNQRPAATAASYTIAANQPTTIPLAGTDGDLDPLDFLLTMPPVFGDLEISAEPTFQTRFSLNGTLQRLTGVVQYRVSVNAITRYLVADTANRRLIEVDGNGALTNMLFLGQVQPHAIASYRRPSVVEQISNSVFSNQSAIADSLVIADVSTNKLHTLVWDSTLGYVPSTGIPIPSAFGNTDPVMSIGFDIADTPGGSFGDQLLIVRQGDGVASTESFNGNFGDGFALTPDSAWNPSGGSAWTIQAEKYAIGPDCDDTAGGYYQVVHEFAHGSIGAGDRIFRRRNHSPSSLTRIDFPSLSLDAAVTGMFVECTGSNSVNLVLADNEGQRLQRWRQTFNNAPSLSNTINIGGRFTSITQLIADQDGTFYAMDDRRLMHFDVFGRLLGLIFTRPDDDDVNGNIARLESPSGSNWVDLARFGDDFYLLNPGDEHNSDTIQRFRFNDGFADFDLMGSAGLSSADGGQALAAEDNGLLGLGSHALKYYPNGDLTNPDLLGDWDDGCDGDFCNVTEFAQIINANTNEPFVDVAGYDGTVLLSDGQRVHALTLAGAYRGWIGSCSAGSRCDVGTGMTTEFCTDCTESGPSIGDQLEVNPSKGYLYVGNGNDQVLLFALDDNGSLRTEISPDGDPNNLLTFLEAGDFTSVNAFAALGDHLYVAEGSPLKRVHFFEVDAFGNVELDQATVTYTPDPGYLGSDQIGFNVDDGLDLGQPAVVSLVVVDDQTAPAITCPADITVELTQAGGAKPLNTETGDFGSRQLADFIEAGIASDNVTLPAVTLTVDVAGSALPAVFPLGTTTVRFTATDATGLDTRCTADVSVVDTVPPQLILDSQLRVVEATGPLTSVDLVAPAVIEVGGGVVISNDAPASFPLGDTVVRWQAIDLSGNVGFADLLVQIVDTTPPDIDPLPATVIAAVNGHSNTLQYSQPTAHDLVSGSVEVACSPGDETIEQPALPYSVYCRAFDASENESSSVVQVEIRQLDGDDDGIADVIDSVPAGAARLGQPMFSDVGLGGVTHGDLAGDTTGLAMLDALQESWGVRASVALASTGEVAACANELNISELTPTIEDGETVPGVVDFSCSPAALRLINGSAAARFILPNTLFVDSQVETGHELSLQGFVATASAENPAPLSLVVENYPDPVLLQPGQSIDLSSVAIPLSSLAITNTDDLAVAVPGLGLTYTINVSNAGPNPDFAVSVADSFPTALACSWTSVADGGATGNSNSSGLLNDSLNMPVGSSVVYTAVCAIDSSATGTLTNTAQVTPSGNDPSLADNVAIDDNTELTPQADAAVSVGDGTTMATPGETTLGYTIIATNLGPSADPNLHLTDVFPNSLDCAWTSLAIGGATGNGNGVGDIDQLLNLPVNSSVTYNALCDIDPSALGTLTNTAVVTSSVADLVGLNDVATDGDTELTPRGNLSVMLADSADPIAAGLSFSYYVTVSNKGPSTARGVMATLDLADALTVTATTGCVNDPLGSPACELSELLPSESVEVVVEVAVEPGTEGPMTSTASVTTSTNETDLSNNSSSEDTLADATAPAVTLVAHVNDLGSVEISECLFTSQSVYELEVTFSEEMWDPDSNVEPGDVTNPLNYRLVASGPDGDFSSATCDGPLDDDVLLAIESVNYDSANSTATIHLDPPIALGDSLYRLKVCSTHRDLGGNPLETDSDSAFQRLFRVERTTMLRNGSFDCTLDEWEATSLLPEEIVHSSEDVDGSTVSGSARVVNLSGNADFALAQCVDTIGNIEQTIRQQTRVSLPSPSVLTLSRSCEFFSETACTGISLVSDFSLTFLEDTAGLWEPMQGILAAPAEADSLRCTYDIRSPSGAPFEVFIDSSNLTTTPLFADGFESGNTAAWSGGVL